MDRGVGARPVASGQKAHGSSGEHARKTRQTPRIHTLATGGLPGTGPSPRGGSPKKGINKANKEMFPIFSEKNRVLKLRFLAFTGGPGGFRELREAGRNHFHLSWYLLVPGITSYDQKPS